MSLATFCGTSGDISDHSERLVWDRVHIVVSIQLCIFFTVRHLHETMMLHESIRGLESRFGSLAEDDIGIVSCDCIVGNPGLSPGGRLGASHRRSVTGGVAPRVLLFAGEDVEGTRTIRIDHPGTSVAIRERSRPVGSRSRTP